MLFVAVRCCSLLLNRGRYERSIGTPEGDKKNQNYNADVRINNVKYAMLAHLKTPDPIFGDVITAHFRIRRDFIVEQCTCLMRLFLALINYSFFVFFLLLFFLET